MIANLPRTPVRSFLAAAATLASLVFSAGTGAQEPAPDSWDEADRPAVERAGAAAAPRITTLRETATGSVHEKFRISIRFSESVTGFDIGDIRVTGARKVPPLNGSGRSYSLTLDTNTNWVGSVIVIIPSGAAENSLGEGNIARPLSFRVDNKAPRIINARIAGRELVLVLDESLDEDFVPEPTSFAVSFIRDAVFDRKEVSRVEVAANQVVLTLTEPVLADDVVELFYTNTGVNAARDRVGNRVPGFNRRSIRNLTTAGSEVPGAPRNLAARAQGPDSIGLVWDEPEEDGGSDITGYWIEVSANGGNTWSDLVANTRSTRTTYTHPGLVAGDTRHYRVYAINPNGVGEPSNVASATTAALLPGAPRRLTARARGTTTIDLGWTAPASDGGSAITGYRIEVSRTGTGGWVALETNANARVTGYSHTGLSPGAVRYYRVAAINRAGTGPWSDVVRATTDTTFPDAPIGLRVVPSGVRGSDQLLLTWAPPPSDGGSAITGYRIEVSPNGGGGWVILVANTGSTGTTYLHTGLPPGTTRFYRVAAVNARGRGSYSNVARGATNAARPGQPRNFRARANGPNSVHLAWDAPESNGGARITGYTIRVLGPNDNSWIIIRPNTGTRATTFTHTGLQPVTRYQYQVAAINSVGAGAWSVTVATLTHADFAGAPAGLTARANGTSRIDLSWNAPRYTGGVSILGYRVEASDDGGATWNIIRRNTNSRTTTFSDVNLRPATTRHYRVGAINLAGVGPFSNVARATTDATVPGVPRGLSAEAVGTSQIALAWRAPSDDGGAEITGYRIEVSDDGGATWQDLVANTRTTRTTYSHTGLEPATTRHYRVSAINRIGVSRASRVASATTDATVPDAPTGLVATATTPTQIDLVWVAPAYDGGAPITGYRIEVSETGAAWTDLQPNTGSAGTTFSHTGLLPGSTRFYRVSAINRAGTGAASGIASAATDDPVERAGRLNTRVLPHVAAAMTSSTVSAIADRVDAVANGMGMERRAETGGLSSMAASLSSPGAGGAGLGRQDRSGLSSLFGGTSFQMPFGATDAPQQTSAGSQMATWGAGEYHYLGEPGSTALDWSGNMVSAHVGVDARVAPDILAGLAASYSSGAFDFTDRTGASPVTGTYGTTMTSVNPYVAWFSGERGTAVWGTAGYGWGDIEVDDLREGLRTSPARTMTGGAGGSYQLLESGIGGVRLKGEGWAGQVMVDGGERIDSVTLNMQRAKLALELKQGYRSSTGDEIAIVLEGGMRYDNGDGVNGTSAEVGGGLRYSNTRMGLIAEGRGRLLISARDGYEEWGIGGMIQLDPAARGQGLLDPAWRPRTATPRAA